MEIIRAYHEKKRRELWCKALDTKSYDEVLKLASDSSSAPPTSSSQFISVAELKKGKYNLKKVPRLALEVVSVETVGNCF